MTGDALKPLTTRLRAVVTRVPGLRRCWRYLTADADGHIAAWQASLMGRRKLTHPSEVTRQRQPVRVHPRATWYR